MLLLMLTAENVSAQLQPAFTQILPDKGLQSKTIYNLHVAKNGLLYIAHSKGLSSFDGNSFINYYNRDVPFTDITSIMETESGSIFCKSFNNVLFGVNNDSLQKIISIPSTGFGYSQSMVSGNTIISAIADSLFLYNTISKKVTIKPAVFFNVIPNSKNVAFIGVSKLNEKYKVFILSDNNSVYCLPTVAPYNGSIHVCNKDVFFALEKSLQSIYYYTKDEYISIVTQQKPLVNYIATNDSMIWVCTTNGLYCRNKNDKGASFKYLLNGYNISDVKQTQEGNLFVSTLGQGLLFIPNFAVNTLSDLPSNITSFNGYKNNLLLGTKDGKVLQYDVATATTKDVISTNKNAVQLVHKSNLVLLISGNNSIINETTTNLSIKDYCYLNSNILLATNVGVCVYGQVSKNSWIEKYVLNNFTSNGLLKKLSFSNEHTSNIKYDSVNKRLYINNYSGIFEMEDGYSAAKQLPNPKCVVKDICVWNGYLLLATKDKGVLKWDGKQYMPAFITKDITDILYKFIVYKNELWVLGEEAVYCYKNNQLLVYNKQLGVNTINCSGFYVDENTVYLNNEDGVVRFNKAIVTQTTAKPLFLLQKVYNSNTNTLITNKSVLAYDNNFVSIRFSLIAYANAANTHLAYSVNDNSIIHLPSGRREINLNFLKPDNYQIQFYTVSNGVISAKPVGCFVFYIRPPFYNTWWFYLIVAIALMCLVYYLSKRQIKKEREGLQLKQAKILLEQELDKSMLTSIKAQMNPHFIFNALNTIQSYIYMNDRRNAGIYISKFSDLTRSILEMSNKDNITLAEEIKSLQLYLSLEKMRFEDSFDYKINAAEDLNKDKITIPSMLLQPYVENAIKHGLLHRKTNRLLCISFAMQKAYLKITIDDNGIGRKRSMELNSINAKNHQSFAMNANKKRLDILKQQHANIELQIVDKYSDFGEALGTQVIISLPLENK